MKKLKLMNIFILTLTLFFSLFLTDVNAYGYQVTLYTGNQGTIDGQNKMSIDVEKNQVVAFDLSKIQLASDSIYYVKGIRISGHDSVDSLDPSTFTVNKDLDYVVVYGVKGEQVAYTIRYLDEDGNPLMEDTTLIGNVGDKPVVAYKYIENYVPQAYALTKTLSDNEKDNVFTFTYQKGETGEVIENTNVVSTVISSTSTNNRATRNQTNGTTTGNDASNTDETTTNTDEDVPQGLVDLDDEETPKSSMDVSNDRNDSSKFLYMSAIILLGTILGLIATFITLKHNKA